MTKKTDIKSLLKVGSAAFILYLCIYYWPNVSKLLGTVLSALTPLLIGGVAAYILNILMNFYEKHFFAGSRKKIICRCRRSVCLISSLITLLSILGLIVWLVVPQLIACVKLLLSEIPAVIDDIVSKLGQTDFISEELIQKISSLDLQSEIKQIAGTVFSGVVNVLDIFGSLVSSAASAVTTAFLAFVFAIYLLAGKDRLYAQFMRLAKQYIKDSRYTKIRYVMSIVNDSFHHFIVGQCIEAVILGTLCTIGMLILRLPYAPMIGAITAFTALIPVVGAFIGGAAGVFLIFMESPVKALIFLIFIIVLQQLEGDLIYPRVVGSSIGLPGIWVLAAVTVGGGILGIIGMLISVPLAAAVYRLLRNHLNGNGKTPSKADASKTDETKHESK